MSKYPKKSFRLFVVAGQAITFILTMGVVMNTSCIRSESGRERTAEVLKAVMELKSASQRLSDYAKVNNGRLPTALEDVGIRITFPHVYQGHEVNLGQSPRQPLIYAIPSTWSDTGNVPILWSDGTAETIAYRDFGEATKPSS